MTPDELRAAMPHAGHRADLYAEPLTAAMQEFGIITAKRQAAFLAQLAHESGSLFYVREIASGSDYEGRKDLGNTQSGDGVRFPGRGLLQITGRINYLNCGNALGLDLIAHPELLEQPSPACRSAGWFWQTRDLSGLSDAEKFGTICRLVNGGYNGLDDRIKHWLIARRALGL